MAYQKLERPHPTGVMNADLNILILEDVPEDAELMTRQLSKAGLRFRSTRVVNRNDFVRELEQAAPDVILSDHGLPEFSGFAALALAREKCPDTPFIFVTGSPAEDEVTQAFESGADDYILKSSISNLAIAVQRTLRDAKSRQKARQRREQLRLILESSKDFAIFTLDLDGRVTEWNAGAEHLFGYTPDEILKQDGRILFTPEDLAKGDAEKEQKIALHRGRATNERWHARKNGDRFWGSGLTMPLLDRAGKPTGFLKIMQDHTERLRMQEALARNEELYRSMVENVEDYAIYMLDAEGRIESWNIGAERTEGYKAGEIIGQHFSIFFIDEDVVKGLPARELERARREGKSRTEGWAVRKGGSRFWSDWTLTAIRNRAGEIRGFCKMAHDVTARKQAQDEIQRLKNELEERIRRRTAQLEASNKELEAFSYSVSHDLRAPLRHISAYAGILREEGEGALPPGTRVYLDKISNSAERMARLIDDLLNFSRVGRAALQLKPVNLRQLVEEARLELRDEAGNRHIEWTIGHLPVTQGDPVLLRQVWINLISNAMKYTRHRQQSRIEIGCSETENEIVCFVRDNGAGFDRHFAQKLFGIFQRLHSETEYPGTGIGLAIVRRVIHRHGGRVWAEGTLGEGATFYFALPRRTGEQHETLANEAAI